MQLSFHKSRKHLYSHWRNAHINMRTKYWTQQPLCVECTLEVTRGTEDLTQPKCNTHHWKVGESEMAHFNQLEFCPPIKKIPYSASVQLKNWNHYLSSKLSKCSAIQKAALRFHSLKWKWRVTVVVKVFQM